MSRRAIWSRSAGSIGLWAWMISIALHLIVLSVFGVVKFSGSKTQSYQRPVPTAKVSQIKRLMQTTHVIPKPKMKKPAKDRFAERPNELLTANKIPGTIKKPGTQNTEKPVASSASQEIFSLPGSGILLYGVEFFGSWTNERKICYVVDCSGSMKGIFGRVKRELAESIQSLKQDQYFHIIFFGGGKFFEFGNGRLVRATNKVKSSALNFIESVQPAGQTNATAAMGKAVQIRDNSGASPSVIYFLTDGFELTTEDAHRFSREIAGLLKQFAPATKINTIGFWPQSSDRKMLETIARQSGGEFVFVSDGNG